MKLPTRRLLTAYALAAATLYTYARHVEPNQIVVERVTLPIRHLPPQADGFKIAVLSDFHAGATERGLLRKAVQITNALRPDVVALIGDYVDRHAPYIFDLAPALAQLQARYGVYGVIGNHDVNPYFHHHQTVIEYGLAYYGIRLLINERVILPNGIALAGLDEPHRGNPDLFAALYGIPQTMPTILMAHRPDFADDFHPDPRLVLQISGHSHGGQIQLPHVGPLVLPNFGRKYPTGLYRVGNMWLYTNRGIGVSGRLKLRLNCPPEITLITLKQA